MARPKYGAVQVNPEGLSRAQCTQLGIVFQKAFDSKAEWNRFKVLSRLEADGQIRHLQCQVPYPIEVAGKKIATYYADFTYEQLTNEGVIEWKSVTEDKKGFRTPEYKLKKKLVEALHGIRILET